MGVSLSPALPGIEASWTSLAVPASGKSVLTLRATKGAKSGVLNVKVEQTLQMLPIQIAIVE